MYTSASFAEVGAIPIIDHPYHIEGQLVSERRIL
jgi:hypothetical protein